jgi:putative ABC transport system permease protein
MLSLETFLQDLKHSLRMFRQSWGFTLAAVAALALGIGANTAIFSVVSAVLLKPVPFPEPERLVMFMTTFPQGQNSGASPAKFQHFREQTTVVQDAAAFRNAVMTYTGGATPEELRGAVVSADYFKLFGAPVIRGRAFSAEEDRPNGERVALISENLWTRRFNRDDTVIGKPLSLNGEQYTVIGVIGSSFNVEEFGPQPDVWSAFQLDPNTNDQGHYFQSAGRLKVGVTLEQAKARFNVSAGDFKRKFPTGALGPNQGFSVQPFGEAFVSNVRRSLMVMVGAVSFVLLIACANVANLLLVRATGRRREIAVRAAIGAGRGRIMRQLLTESVVLSLTGGAIGLALGIAGIKTLLTVNTAGLPRIGREGTLVGIDWRVLAFTFAVSIGTGILFGLIPALQGSRADLSSTLKESGGRSGTGFRQNKARSVLVVIEVALALILLIGSALLIRTSLALRSVDPGFDTSSVLTMRMSLAGPSYQKSEAVELLVRTGVERLKAIPGVVSASATCCVPLEGGYGLPFIIVGRPLEGPAHGGGGWITSSPGFFDVYRIPIRKGRAFSERDTANSPPVVIINEAMARQYWPKGDPLNDRLAIGRGVMREFKDEPERQIIGIVGDVRDGGLNNEPGPRMYIPQSQVPDAANALNVRLTPMAWVVRTRVKPMSLSAVIQEELKKASGLPVSDIRAMDEVVQRSMSRQRFNMWLMSVFGGSALLLAAIGIYGLMAYSVQQRTQEIGIRLALGAEARHVKNMVVFQGMALTMVGVIVGLASALALARVLQSLLFGVQARDPLVFVAVPVVLSLVAFLAVWIPARRASRVDPLIALRYE